MHYYHKAEDERNKKSIPAEICLESKKMRAIILKQQIKWNYHPVGKNYIPHIFSAL